MFFLKSDITGDDIHIYQQICIGIKEQILSGALLPNEKLPSKRKLADMLKVSVNSVTNAYEQLLAEGYIYSLERKGYYVENITKLVKNNKNINIFPKDLKEDFRKEDGWLSLSHMTSDISVFPFNEWMKCQRIAIHNHQNDLAEIVHPQGPYLVRKTLSRLIALSRGVICEPEQIVFGDSTQTLIRNLISMQEGNPIVAVEDPGYSRLYTMLKIITSNVLTIELDDKGIDIEKVESSGAKFLFVTPSHQFPTGIIMPISRRIELLNWSIQTQNRYIVEDDYDSEFKYKTDNIPSLQSLDTNQRVIYIGTFSKTMFPGVRISYMVLPPKLLKEYRQQFSNLIQGSNSLGLFALHYFIEQGYYDRHVKRMNLLYEMKRDLIIKELYLRFGDDIQIKDVSAGLHFLARFKTNKTYEEIKAMAIQRKLEIYSMRRFMLKNKYHIKNKIELIVGFATIDEKDIVDAVERLYQIIKGF